MDKANHLKYKFECGICDTRIWDYQNGKIKKTPEYREIDVRLSDLTNMTVGVCSRCIKPKKHDLLSMTEKMRRGWVEEVAFGFGNAEWVKNKGLSLEIVGLKT